MINITPVTQLKGVGAYLATRLKKLNIHTIQDLLFHLPFRYQDRTQVTPIAQLKPGEYAVIEGQIQSVSVAKGKRKSLIIYVSDITGHIFLRFFYFNVAQQQDFSQREIRIRCFGEIRVGKFGLEMVHPEYSLFKGQQPNIAQNLTAIYSTTEGLSQNILRKLIKQSLNLLHKPQFLSEWFPVEVLQEFELMPLHAAIQLIHQPPAETDKNLLMQNIHPAQIRLFFEELLAHQLLLIRYRQQIKKNAAHSMADKQIILQQFISQLPYQLTAAQAQVIDEIISDLKCNQPMLRLVQGDVGSGKTVVAAAIALQVLANGFQVALMAPTELLAEQHYHNFQKWLGNFNFQIVLLTSKTSNKNKILEKIYNCEAQLIIGTHSIFQENVLFQNLALVIIDEQHRFGVEQRLALQQKGVKNNFYPHQLIMTATPIPRTLMMANYADLDCSIINELPKGRVPITTLVISNQRRGEIIQRINEAAQNGRQIYWVCTLIEESEVLQCQAAENTFQELSNILPGIRMELIHGRLKAGQKEQIMQDFKQHKLDLLVATTVIEVGVDVPNASLMIIENPERLGLAQLHQLRGRVGRGHTQSHCVLLYQLPLSFNAKQRLEIMRKYQDGFKIAEFDLSLRGPGEMLGTRQKGLLQFKVSDLLRDQHLLKKVQQAANIFLEKYPQVVEKLIQRWKSANEHFANV